MIDQIALSGACLAKGAASACIAGLESALGALPKEKAGSRINDFGSLRPFLSHSGCIGKVAVDALGSKARPVRVILFNKTAATNWALGWHQDRTICVAQKIDVEGFGPWTTKNGQNHVAPPYEILANMVTLPVHLDDVDANNAPLKIALGTNRLGRIAEAEIESVLLSSEITTCTAVRGDIWVYATPILHASDAAATPQQRRVLQIDYAAQSLPGGLEWAIS